MAMHGLCKCLCNNVYMQFNSVKEGLFIVFLCLSMRRIKQNVVNES